MNIRGFNDVQNEVELLKKSLYFGFVEIPEREISVKELIGILLPNSEGGSLRIERNGDMYFVYETIDYMEVLTISFYFDKKSSKFRLLFDAFDGSSYDENTMKFSM